MGQRANIVIVENGSSQLYYDHWCGNALDLELFWGPEDFAAFVRQRDPEDDEYWLDERWCDGAALLDLNRRSLLFFGGECARFNVRHRRVYFNLLRPRWPGWRIEWAHEGIVSIARAIGLPLDDFLVDSNPAELTYNAELSVHDIILSTVDRDGSSETRCVAGSWEALQLGPAELERAMEQAPPVTELVWDAEEYPRGGIHVDYPARILGTWWSDPTPRLESLVTRAWPGWNLRWWRDEFERQVELASVAISFTGEATYAPAILASLWARSQQEEPTNPARGALSALGEDAQINPCTDHTRGSLDGQRKREILWQEYSFDGDS